MTNQTKKRKEKEDKIMSTKDALRSRGNIVDQMSPSLYDKKPKKNIVDQMSPSLYDKKPKKSGLDKKTFKKLKKKFGGGGGGGGGLSMKAQLEGNLPGKKKYKSGGMVKKSRDGIAKRGKTKGRFI